MRVCGGPGWVTTRVYPDGRHPEDALHAQGGAIVLEITAAGKFDGHSTATALPPATRDVSGQALAIAVGRSKI